MNQSIENLSINTIRLLAAEAVQKANSGHPGMPMGCAPIAFSLYTKFMKHNPKNPKWINRDRFILSAGHGSMLLYSILHLCGYEISLDDIKNFRQWKSITPGHPEYGVTPGVETTTGPLGQGFANAVGMAIARNYLASLFNKDEYKIIDHYIFGICGDGDLMEGVSHEAASLAGHLKLSKLIFFYDNNEITIDGKTSLAFSENIQKRFEAYGWCVIKINDVNDPTEIEDAVFNSHKSDKPVLIITNTHIGFGSPNKQDKESAHGSPLGEAEIELTKKNLGWKYEEKFFIPEEVTEFFSSLKFQFTKYEDDWNLLYESYKNKFPELANQLENFVNGELGDDWKASLPTFVDDGKKIATRQASGKVLNSIAPHLENLIGGSADLAPSNNTYLSNYPAFSSENYNGRNFHFGVREHGMGSILNGMALYGGVIPYGGTFLVFSDYLRPAIRMAALSHIRSIFVMTHDSIGLGEDGPTHQPVEHLAALRAIPNVIVIRPADANETVAAWKVAIETKDKPVILILSRQALPVLDQTKYSSAENLINGGYILYQTNDNPTLIILATGSELQLALNAVKQLEEMYVSCSVVSFPSWELFEAQSPEYKEAVLPKKIKSRIAIEAGVGQGWHKYVGDKGKVISIDKFGASAPENILYEEYGITVDRIVSEAKKIIK
ncbi:MAG: transketolase [Chlorobiaceae bacterium]|nr:transketolase [Chlorobiaceae bacterium]MBA4309284.1 transketolase [Chlorobiaceae bacterium]